MHEGTVGTMLAVPSYICACTLLWSAMQPAEEPTGVDEQHIPAPRDEPALTDRELEILSFESRWWKHAGAKEQAIRDTFALSSTRYYQILNGLLDNPAALAHDPVLIGRLRRLRLSKARTRRR
jgi:uncharacterized protein DUF3263